MLKALIATDLSEAATLGVDAACQAGADVFEHVTLVHVVDLDLYTAGGSVPGIMEFARERLAEETSRMEACGIGAEAEVVQGDTVETLERLAAEREADLIVTTSLGKGAALGRIFGSTAEKLASRGKHPVLIERVEVNAEETCCRLNEGSPFSRVLVAAGLDESTDGLLAAVRDLPGVETFRVVHVAEAGQDTGSLEADVEVAVLESDDVAAAIVEEAVRFEATLVAVASCRHGALHRAVWGSVARSVAREARSSVLLVPGAAEVRS